MHACGHDVHLAALWAVLTAARGLDLPAAMVPILQPREEVTPPGASDVVASGLLDEEGVEAMIGVHVQPGVEAGIVSTGAGAVNAAYDSFEIEIAGSPPTAPTRTRRSIPSPHSPPSSVRCRRCPPG
ncbi:amidohydrolase [Tessaracoccus sp. HDW20]|uniref:M20/M25/M40 family metallo-hydrolase n=1 Tax=Tessaracoccus coleopterorum TaxID=2714950 RepID=UPI0018D42925|nr:M20/M25/M40 family metallo-hydrolase [Tessaracoccus coleopterorum]NHB84123.1 amidohydrolase [Tessaracoccus coleopterorum]